MSRLLLAQLLALLCLSEILVSVVLSLKNRELLGDDNDGDETRKKQRPHIVIILADDMGWNDVSFHGSDQIPTPNIDALAYNGIILNNHYVSALCTPSRSALMTGKYPTRLGMQHSVLLPAEPRGLPLSETLLPEYLKETGYKTHMIGKWHLGFHRHEYTPTYRGFDTHFGYWNGLQDYYNHEFIMPSNSPELVKGFDMRRNMSVAWDTMNHYSTDLFTEEAVRLINAHDRNEPMFLYLAHLAPHSGNNHKLLQAPSSEIAKFSYILNPERRIYAAMVSKLDQSVGETVAALKNRGMLDNSIIIFMADNGAPTDGFLYNRGSNYPLRGMKNSPWEGAVRGAAAIWSPLIEKRERVSSQLMYIADWLPTLLSAAGVSKEKIPKIDGCDLWEALVSDGGDRRSEVLINIDDIANYTAIRRGDFKYVSGKTDEFFTWLGDSGKNPLEQRPPYDPEKVLRSKAGVAIASVTTAEQTSKRRRKADQSDVPAEYSADSKLTPQKILRLRQQAKIRCNVTEQERISCNPFVSPCLFNIAKDPCEMINIIGQQPAIAGSLEEALKQHRLNVVSPANINPDPRANPKYWNNAWSCWLDAPWHLS